MASHRGAKPLTADHGMKPGGGSAQPTGGKASGKVTMASPRASSPRKASPRRSAATDRTGKKVGKSKSKDGSDDGHKESKEKDQPLRSSAELFADAAAKLKEADNVEASASDAAVATLPRALGQARGGVGVSSRAVRLDARRGGVPCTRRHRPDARRGGTQHQKKPSGRRRRRIHPRRHHSRRAGVR